MEVGKPLGKFHRVVSIYLSGASKRENTKSYLRKRWKDIYSTVHNYHILITRKDLGIRNI